MSAAFDVVDTEILLEKLKLYGFDKKAIQWTWSYLTHRSQAVYIEGSMSSILALEAGVPQGSILGPIFYTIFTNELPQVVHEQDCPLHDDQSASIFTLQCHECGGVCCYADDSTFTVREKDPGKLSEKLSQKYKVMADFLTDNKLKVNDDKSHLLVMTTRQKRRTVDTNNVKIQTASATISPSPVERLLGAQVHQDMRWVEHILENENSLVKSLNLRQAAMKKLSRVASFKTRKIVASGIFMSKLIYLMPLWAGCEDYLIKALQVVQNKAARTVAKLNIFTPTKTLMKVCGWMSVRQLQAYHSLMLLHKTISNQKPVYFLQNVTAGGKFPYKTRQAATCPPGFSFQVNHPSDSGAVRPGSAAKKGLTKLGWCSRSVELYNTLPTELRLERKMPNFKKMNVSI